MLNPVQHPSKIYDNLIEATDLHSNLKRVWSDTPGYSQGDILGSSASLVSTCLYCYNP